MTALIIAIHAIVCILLIIIILIQSARGGGLIESFSGIESMFGQKTSAFLTRATTVLSTVFFITCLSLALLSARQSRSLIKNTKAASEQAETTAQTQEAPAAESQGDAQPQPAQAQEAPEAE